MLANRVLLGGEHWRWGPALGASVLIGLWYVLAPALALVVTNSGGVLTAGWVLTA